jgi:single-stranded DNA-binding protein
VNRLVGEGKGDPDRDGKTSAYKTTWLNTVFFNGTARFVAEKFSQGDTIVVQGELETSTYEKKDQDGNVIDSNAMGMRVIANKVEGPFRVVSKNGNGESVPVSTGVPASFNSGQARQAVLSRQGAPTRQAPVRQAAPTEDDVPF